MQEGQKPTYWVSATLSATGEEAAANSDQKYSSSSKVLLFAHKYHSDPIRARYKGSSSYRYPTNQRCHSTVAKRSS